MFFDVFLTKNEETFSEKGLSEQTEKSKFPYQTKAREKTYEREKSEKLLTVVSVTLNLISHCPILEFTKIGFCDILKSETELIR